MSIATMTDAAAVPAAPQRNDNVAVSKMPMAALISMIRLMIKSMSNTSIVCVPKTLINPN
ncbi:MAG: hypothetical protein JO185_03795, partial [Acidobacteriaceae bacterium]|nr:hypothetical protein [Acidobacteriaceae bacterium]